MITAAGICKRFGAVQALKAVDFVLKTGEIHGLVGENGAGKSTLMKIFAGVYPPDSGSLRADDAPIRLRSPKHAYEIGIRIVHQEFSLIPALTVAENLYLHELSAGSLRPIDRRALALRARDLLNDWKLDISPTVRIEQLSMGKRQLVEILREVSKRGSILILDEPTSSLTNREIDHLFQVLRKLKQQNISIVFISHRLDEVLTIADTVTVLRNGKKVGSHSTAEVDLEQIIALMLGREVGTLFPKRDPSTGEKILSLHGLSGEGFSEISLHLRQGEILGIAGLMGAGCTELLRGLFGLNRTHSGSIKLNGTEIALNNSTAAIEFGFVLLSENRIDEGIFPDLSVAKNLVVMKLEEVSTKGWLRTDLVKKKVSDLVKVLNVVTYDPHRQPVRHLSGGNQQKVVLARLMGADPRILLLDEPTRGVDVGTKAEIHRKMADFVAQGNAIIMVSSDIPELMGMCDRIIVLYQGRMAGHFNRNEFRQEEILRCSMEGGVRPPIPSKNSRSDPSQP
ncbi:sugar ABC transporter ATP-binding protein [Acidobacteria bacterium AH-259-L09]|nr:sugar ABC transporter ATP-binding protein [Acidobacteria bacterium AH-259-L09]